MKAQVSMEYILLFAISLLVVSVLWSVSSSNIENTQWEVQLASARSALDKITNTADITHVQGEPAQIYINIDFPQNIRNVYMAGNSVTLELLWKGAYRNISAQTSSNLTGYISAAPGRHRLLVKAGPMVNITEA